MCKEEQGMLVAPDVFQVQIPLPFALKIVNCYLVRGPEGWALVDTGINWPPALDAWRAALDVLGLRPRDIAAIYVTHYHPDHLGLAGWWQEQSGAPVLMTPVEREAALQVWGDLGTVGQQMVAIYRAHGMPEPVARAILENVARTRRMLDPLPEITALDLPASLQPNAEPGAPLSVAGRLFAPLLLAGHADAQLGLYEAASKTLLVADHVLVKISPNISYGPRGTPDPLARYLASFAGLEALDVGVVLPGHGPIFHQLRGRLRELRSHHDERLGLIERLLDHAATGYEVCQQVFPMASLSPHQQQFAMGETLAHLEQLVLLGRAERVEDTPLRYRRLSER
jgi:glyoxylase-like metal-dependent hydrolase (beta-lactamase superfamily II)